MRFIKMHGIGNDYVYVNGFAQAVSDPGALAVQVADRHFGIGGDGLILVLPASEGTDAHVRMRMFNADGSEAEMCGNGIRCVCKLAYDHNVTPGIRDQNPMRIETGNGVLTLRYQTNGDGKVRDVTVDMGEPAFHPETIPANIDGVERIVNHDIKGLFNWPTSLGEEWIAECGLDQRMTCVATGNPHVILYCTDVSKVPLEQVGPIIENASVFPARINVHFVQIHSRDELTMRTWERGSGITLACGTGASAVAVAGVLTDHNNRRVLAHLPGGDLTLEWKEDNHIDMTGTADEVFTGEWPG